MGIFGFGSNSNTTPEAAIAEADDMYSPSGGSFQDNSDNTTSFGMDDSGYEKCQTLCQLFLLTQIDFNPCHFKG